MRLLVTGAAGFIGTNFLKRVQGDPAFEVLAVYHRREPLVEARNIHYTKADLRDFAQCLKLTEGIDQVCMLAGRLSTAAILSQNPLGPVTENTVINTQMLEAAYRSRVKKFLWLSSTTGYPSSEKTLREEDFFLDAPPPPYEPVGWLSRYLEKLSLLYATKAKPPMTVITLRPTAVFGEYDTFNFESCHALPALMRRVIERQSPIEMWGTGEEERDWLYVGDLVEACLLALEKLDGYEALNIGSGQGVSLNELLQCMLKLDGYREAQIKRHAKKSGATAVRRFDCSRAERLLGFRAKTPLDQSLSSTMRWFRSQRSPVVKGALS